jgi:hypothetical protein
MPVGELIQLIAQSGGLLGLAVFSIWMLNKAHVQRAEELKAAIEQERARTSSLLEHDRVDRAELISALNRNTEAWITQIKASDAVTQTMTKLCTQVDGNRSMITDMRTLLAERPCTAPAIAAELRKERDRL